MLVSKYDHTQAHHEQLEMSKATLIGIFAFAEAIPLFIRPQGCAKELEMTCRQVSCCVRLVKAFKNNKWTTYN
jgi:hypothetical protein